MSTANTHTSLGKWSVALALSPAAIIALVLLWFIIPAWLGQVGGESGLGLMMFIGEVLFGGSYVLIITCLTGVGLAIAAIHKTHWRRGLPGFLLNALILIAPVACLTSFYHEVGADPNRIPISAHRGDYRTVEKLLDKGFDINRQCGSATALSYAAGQGNEEAVRMLVDRGADVNIANPLGEAAQKGNETIVRLLLDHGANPNCLKNAIYGGNLEIIKILIDHGAHVNQRVDNSGRTPLQTAVERACEESIKLLITEGADVNLSNDQGETPLHVLVRIWPHDSWKEDFRTRAISILLDAGADIEAKTRDGKTPLELATQSKNSADAVKALLDRGANSGE